MKKMLLVFSVLFHSFLLFSQCQVAVYTLMPDCDSLCNGTMQAQPLGGTPPYSYLWSNGNTTQIATNLCASTSYSVTVTDSTGCITSAWNTIPPIMQVWISVATPPSCPTCCDGVLNGNVYDQSGCFTHNFSWTPLTSWGSQLANACVGTYSLCVTNSCGCVRCDSIFLGTPLGIENSSSHAPIFYPQPFSESTMLLIPSGIKNGVMEVYDVEGILIRKETSITGTQIIFERKNLSEGYYFYRISSENTGLLSGHLIVLE